MSKRIWTTEKIELLSKLKETNSNVEIAKIFNTTVGSIEKVIRRFCKRSKEEFHNVLSKESKKNARDINGEKNPRWKGGVSKDNYRYKKRQMERYPERIKARLDVLHAKKSGKLKKGKCEVCGSTDVVAHHDDYSKPLEVRWFCRKHHRECMHKGRY
jgi:ribosomal protein S27AE